MTHILLDAELFQYAYDSGNGYRDFLCRHKDAQDAASIRVLRSEIGDIAAGINYYLIPRAKHADKQITMADYMAKQKVIVPIANHFHTKVGTGPISLQLVHKELRRWGFVPEQMDITIKKCRRFASNRCYLEITFKKK